VSQIVTYSVDNSTSVRFEIAPVDGFSPASPGQVVGKVQDAVGPVVEAAKVVLDRVREAGPDQVELKFGIKVSGSADWFVAKAAGEGSFEITLSWDRHAGEHDARLDTAADPSVKAEPVNSIGSDPGATRAAEGSAGGA